MDEDYIPQSVVDRQADDDLAETESELKIEVPVGMWVRLRLCLLSPSLSQLFRSLGFWSL
jgi:hypothetical protein